MLEQKAFVYVSGLTETAVAIRGLLTVPPERGKGHARKLLRGLAAIFPDRAFSVPTLIPEDLAPRFFTALGFIRSDLAQIEMSLDLA